MKTISSFLSFKFILLISTILLTIVCSNASQVNSSDNNSVKYRDSWIKLEYFTKNLIKIYVRSLEDIVLPALKRQNVTQQCSSSLINFIEDLALLKSDAIKVADSSGSWPTGLMSGNLYSYGSYDQCISLDTSQYCVLELFAPLPQGGLYEGYARKIRPSMIPFNSEAFQEFRQKIHFFRVANFTHGLCLPKGCRQDEIDSLATRVLNQFDTGLMVTVRGCESKINKPRFNVYGYISIVVITSIVALNLLGTYGKHTALSAFNFKANYDSLTKTSSNKSLSCLEGIKTISMFIVILSHTFGLQLDMHTSRLFKIEETLSDPGIFLSYTFPFAVDTFFMVTGIKTMQYILQQGTKRPNLIGFLLVRYLCFVPLVGFALCIAFILTSDPVKASLGGPNWSAFKAFNGDACQQTWLTNLLLIHMWFEWDRELKSCLLTDWYLSTDLIYAAMTTAVWILLSQKRVKSALLYCWMLIFFGIFASAASIKLWNLRSFWRIIDFLDDHARVYNNLFHLKPIAHLSPYFVGVLAGYYIIRHPKTLSKSQLLFGWLLWLLCSAIKLFFFYYDDESTLYDWSRFVYGTLSKTLWSCMIVWLIYSIERLPSWKGIASSLSSPGMQILSRLSLSLMCLNIIILKFKNATTTVPSDINHFKFTIIEHLPYIFITYVLAFVSTLTVGYPTTNLLRQIFMNGGRRDEKNMTKNLSRNEKIDSPSELKMIKVTPCISKDRSCKNDIESLSGIENNQ
ncbi:O-acyltransferase like protein-like [Brevipalpus obovatus]|uniref:O-acyltransferase like protein-like n=1 Tax=Brevipalpus obovatus TaxID=246614 RepID=UPI003D9E3E75